MSIEDLVLFSSALICLCWTPPLYIFSFVPPLPEWLGSESYTSRQLGATSTNLIGCRPPQRATRRNFGLRGVVLAQLRIYKTISDLESTWNSWTSYTPMS